MIAPETMHKMSRMGMTYSEIGQKANMTRNQVAGYLYRYRREMDKRGIERLQQSAVAREPNPNGSIAKQNALVAQGNLRLQRKLDQLKSSERWGKLMFVGDLHIPYHDPRVIDLHVQLARDFAPDMITAMNDGLDWNGYSRHQEDRSSSEIALTEDDVVTGINAYREYIELITSAAPQHALLFQVQGNHDEWIYTWARANMKGAAEYFIYNNLMLPFAQMNIALLSRGDQNTVKLSPGLKVHHGLSAAKLPSTIAKNTLEQLAGQSSEDDFGVYYNVVTGHVHRMHEIPMYGVKHWSSGCGRDMNPSYMNRVPNWQHGITLVYFEPNGRRVVGTNVEYMPDNGNLMAFWGGKQYKSMSTVKVT